MHVLMHVLMHVCMHVLNLCTRFFHPTVRADPTVHAMSATFRKTMRYKKVVCCVLNLCSRFFHQTVRGDQTVHAVSARFRKTRRCTKVVCCVLSWCTRFIHQTVRGDQTVHAVSARFRRTRRYTKVVCCVLMIHYHTRFGPPIMRKCEKIFKVVPKPPGMLKHVFLARFEPVGARFGPWKFPKCLENGPFQDEKWVKNGSKRVFQIVIRDHWGCTNHSFNPILSLCESIFGPCAICMHVLMHVLMHVCMHVLNLCSRFFHPTVRADPTVHAVRAGFRKTMRYKKVVCCVLNLCSRFFRQNVRGDQTVHAVSARFRKTRRYAKVVCCVLSLCTRFIHQTVRGDPTVHAVSARFLKTGRYSKVVCCVLTIHSQTRFGPAIMRKCLDNEMCMM